MKAVHFENQTVSIIDIPVPEVHQDEALVRVTMAGICATDLGIFYGYADFSGVPGHEFVGVVEKCDSRPELVGKRVVADINCGCGTCRVCVCEDARHCPDREVVGIRRRDGAFAEFCKLPLKNLHEVPHEVETNRAVFAEPLAAALQITQQLHIGAQARIAVLGDGKLGLLTALALRHYNPNVLLIGKHSEKLAIAENRKIAVTCLMPDEKIDAVRKRLGSFGIIVDATGSPDGINMAVSLCRPKGTVVVKTTVPEPSRIDLADIAVNELRIIGSRCGDMSLSLHFLKNQWIDVFPLIDTVYAFSRFNEAFSRALEKDSMKVLVDFGKKK